MNVTEEPSILLTLILRPIIATDDHPLPHIIQNSQDPMFDCQKEISVFSHTVWVLIILSMEICNKKVRLSKRFYCCSQIKYSNVIYY